MKRLYTQKINKCEDCPNLIKNYHNFKYHCHIIGGDTIYNREDSDNYENLEKELDDWFKNKCCLKEIK
jgi:hypothetical protein